MQRCAFCGSELPDQARFCGFCGHPLNIIEARAVTDIHSGTLPATMESVTDISTASTGPLLASSPQATSTGQVRMGPVGAQENLEPSTERDDEEEEDSGILIDIAVPLMPATSMPMVAGIPSITNVPMVSGNPSINSAPTVSGNPSGSHASTVSRPPSVSTPPAPASPHTGLPQTPPHAMPPHTEPPQTPPPIEHRPSYHSSHPPDRHTKTSTTNLHHPHTDSDTRDLHHHYTGPGTHHLQHSYTGIGPNTQDDFVSLDAEQGYRPPEKSRSHPAQSKGRKRRKIALVALLLVACIILVVVGGSLALARIFPSGPNPASSATVTITPASSDLQNTYTISVVTGKPDASQNQVGGARMISTTTSSFTQTAKATGQGTIPGTQASGTMQVENHDPSNTLTIAAGSVFPNQLSPAIHMQLDQSVTIPPGGYTQVPAHVVEAGTIGNLPGPCCGPGPNFQNQCDGNSNCGQAHDMFNNSAFTGGTDPQTYSVVQQSDIDGGAHALEQANAPNAQQVLQGQVQANEQFIGTPQCKPNVTSDHAAGDKATSVTVNVTFTCIGEVFTQQAALSLARQLLTNQATTNLGSAYALAGGIATSVINAALSNASQGTVAMTINAEGVWVYQFSTAQQQALAKLMANKKKQAVQSLLLKQQGVVQETIHLVGGDGTLFPTDPRHIKIVVQNVPGLQGTATASS